MIDCSTYRTIVELMPICCVDVLIHEGNQYLLCRRTNEPAKGLWWFPGGRILKGETYQRAVHRKALDETGLEIVIERLVGVYDMMFPTSSFEVPTHTIDLVCLVKPRPPMTLSDLVPESILKQHSEFKTFTRIEDDLPPHIKEVLVEAKLCRMP